MNRQLHLSSNSTILELYYQKKKKKISLQYSYFYLPSFNVGESVLILGNIHFYHMNIPFEIIKCWSFWLRRKLTFYQKWYVNNYSYQAMSREFAGSPCFNPRSSYSKDSKMVLDAALLSIQHYKVRIKGKVKQS